MATRRQPPDDNAPDFSFLGDSEQSETAHPGEIAPPESVRSVHPHRDRSKARIPAVETGSPAGDEGDTDSRTSDREARPADSVFRTHDLAAQNHNIAGVGGSRVSGAIVGYAIGLTCLFLFLLVTGRVSLFGGHPLESLPDLRPLQPNEFQRIPDDAALPENHVLEPGQSQRFGDVVVRPTKITREPLQFQGFLSGEVDERMTTAPVLKLWIEFENVAEDYAFVPFDVGLMSHRSPSAGVDEETLANSFLTTAQVTGADPSAEIRSVRLLNFLHSPDSNFVIVGQNAGRLIQPGETVTVFVACAESPDSRATADADDFTWRVQFRKGVNLNSGHGVTTLVDVRFSATDIGEMVRETASPSAAVVTPG